VNRRQRGRGAATAVAGAMAAVAGAGAAAGVALALSAAQAAGGGPGDGAAREAHLAFELEPRLRPTDGATGMVPVAAKWIEKDGRAAWRVALPERLTRALPLGEPEASIYRTDDRRYDVFHSFVGHGVIAAGASLLVADLSGLLVLARADGAVELDWEAAASPSGEALYFDAARIEVTGAGKKACRGTGARGRFLLLCGGTAVYCNRSRFAVFREKPWRLVGEVPYEGKVHDVPTGRAGTWRVKARVGGLVVGIDGMVYLF